MARKNYQDKTEKPTPKRLKDARKKGQVAQSKEIPSVVILMASVGVFFFIGAKMFSELSGFMGAMFQNIAIVQLNDIPSASIFLMEMIKTTFRLLWPLMLVILLAGVGANVAQFGFLISHEPLMPKFSKLNPASGIKKLLSLRSLIELIKSLIKILFVGIVAFIVVKTEVVTIPSLVQHSVIDMFAYIGKISLKICFTVSLVLLLLAFLDYAYQRWEHEKSLKMTKQEVKDEHKQTEGDPKVKARIRSIQLETARQRMMDAVPDADVIITNPTHIAVALKFEADEMIAPCVVAKGSGYIAEKIKQTAVEYGVPVVENKPLARMLYKAVEIGGFIPADLYKAVAEILAYVYRLKGTRPNL